MRALFIVAFAIACNAPAYEGCERTELLAPEAGELTIVQLRLSGTFKHGEAAAVIGPDGTLALIDIGNSSHTEEIVDAVRAINTRCVTPEHGFEGGRGELDVDWIVITHFHGDHAGSLEELLLAGVVVRRGIVHRGLVDLGAGMNAGTYAAVCNAVRGPLAELDVPLCSAAAPAPCTGFTESHEAERCDGLMAGDLSDPNDRGPSYVALGEGARLTFLAADAFVSDGRTIERAASFGYDANNEENARSVVGIVEHGAFRYHFGGDLTGAGTPGVPDVEGPLAAIAGPRFYGALGADVVHGHHHLRDTSSNAAFVELATPADGRSRNVLGGIAAHVGSPHGAVLQRFADDDRLGDGMIWITRSASGGDSHPRLIEADAAIVIRTFDGGERYEIEAAREEPLRMSFRSVRAR